jgi:hypothetical protein
MDGQQESEQPLTDKQIKKSMKDEKPLTETQIRNTIRKEFPGITKDEEDRYVRAELNGKPIVRQWMERQKTREIKRVLRKAYPDKTEEELDRLTKEASDGAEWYQDLKKGKKSLNFLKSEYSNLSKELADELAKNHAHEEWFQSLMKGPRLAEDKPKTGHDAIVVAANAGGVAKDDTPAVCEEQYGAAEQYDDEAEAQMLDMERQIRVAEWAFKLARYGRTDGVRCLHISIALQILKNQIQISELAEYHGVTTQRIKQAIKEVKSFEIFDHWLIGRDLCSNPNSQTTSAYRPRSSNARLPSTTNKTLLIAIWPRYKKTFAHCAENSTRSKIPETYRSLKYRS